MAKDLFLSRAWGADNLALAWDGRITGWRLTVGYILFNAAWLAMLPWISSVSVSRCQQMIFALVPSCRCQCAVLPASHDERRRIETGAASSEEGSFFSKDLH